MADVCPVCASHELDFVRVHGEYRLWECNGCGVQHWTPLTHPDAAYYEDEAHGMYADKHRGDTGLERRFGPFLAEFGQTTNKRVLDVGCSDGWLLAQLAARGNDVHGIDIDRKALAVARGRGLTQISQMSVEEYVGDARENQRAFDFITMFDVLEHTTDPVSVLRALAGLLAEGGRLIGTVPNRQRFLANEVVSDFPPHHFFRFDRRSLRRCGEQAGMAFEKVNVFEYGYTGSTALAALRRRFRRSPVPNGAAGSGASAVTRARKLRHLVAGAMRRVVAPPSALLERSLGRGFKLYFVANRSP